MWQFLIIWDDFWIICTVVCNPRRVTPVFKQTGWIYASSSNTKDKLPLSDAHGFTKAKKRKVKVVWSLTEASCPFKLNKHVPSQLSFSLVLSQDLCPSKKKKFHDAHYFWETGDCILIGGEKWSGYDSYRDLRGKNKQTIMTVTMIKADSDERIRKIYLPTSGHLSCFCPTVAM